MLSLLHKKLSKSDIINEVAYSDWIKTGVPKPMVLLEYRSLLDVAKINHISTKIRTLAFFLL